MCNTRSTVPLPLLPRQEWSAEDCLVVLRLRALLVDDVSSRPFRTARTLAEALQHVFRYLSHHYLVDLCAGGQLACSFFYFFLSRVPDELRHPTGLQTPYSNGNALQEDPEAALDSHNFGGWGGSVGGDDDDGFELPEANTGLMRDNSIDGESAPYRSSKAV
jgi:hypothetical protein